MKKPKAYLAWPVKLQGVDSDYHITCKYLGTTTFTVEDICERLKGINTKIIIEHWRPEVFNNFGHLTHVLLIVGYRANLRTCHRALNSMAKAEYHFNPHITVDRDVWNIVNDLPQIFNPENTIESIGPLTLYVDKKPTETF